ncbi:uncharacterized protein LOC116297541 [Actinia tenebrosa]|uniref:Uncharacterized protein LOC116297541 n=1 Tax=Actinia tenebrosa TaxID=6105 RepID=A0A6P8I287_ACTTE|nr:uncharacterized protein LOC116297541 [Actinia tenebrosa]
MYLGTLLLGAATTWMLTSMCSAGICDEGPPGKFCFPDLSGYHDCVVNKTTGKIDDKLYNCPQNTRCKCMGIPCSTNTPCGPYRLPPIFADDFTADINDIKTVVTPAGKQTTYSHFGIWRDSKNQKYRLDATIAPHDPPYEYFILLPNNQSSFDVYEVIPSTTSCKKTTITKFPPKLQEPSYFQYNGTVIVTGIVCDHWIWLSGGRNSGRPIISQSWDTNQKKPIQYLAYSPGSQMSKTSVRIQRYFGLFDAGTPDPEKFVLPRYCEKELEKTPKPSDEFFESRDLVF